MLQKVLVGAKVDSPKSEKWTAPKVEGRSKVNGPAEKWRSWVKVDGLWMESGRTGQNRTFWLKVGILVKMGGLAKSGRSQRRKVNGHNVEKWTVSD